MSLSTRYLLEKSVACCQKSLRILRIIFYLELFKLWTVVSQLQLISVPYFDIFSSKWNCRAFNIVIGLIRIQLLKVDFSKSKRSRSTASTTRCCTELVVAYERLRVFCKYCRDMFSSEAGVCSVRFFENFSLHFRLVSYPFEPLIGLQK